MFGIVMVFLAIALQFSSTVSIECNFKDLIDLEKVTIPYQEPRA